MSRLVALASLATLTSLTGGALAAPAPTPPPGDAPLDPYGEPRKPATPVPGPAPAPAAPAPASAPPTAPATPAPAAGALEARLAEEIAFSLAARAQELLDAKQYEDARQLANEAIARSPGGVAAERAQVILRAVAAALGQPVVEPAPTPETPAAPTEDPVSPTPLDEHTEVPSPRLHAMIHGGLAGGLVGATVGSLADDSAGVEVALGAAGAAAGAYFAPRLLRRFDVEQVRTMGSAAMWGGAVGGLLADVTTSLTDTSPRQVLLGATLGAVAGSAGGYWLARDRTYTRGDVALIDTLAGIGAVGGLTLGLAMQPVQTEGYSLNAVFGIAAGVAGGMFFAPTTNTTPRRMARVAGLAAAGAAAPWLVYPLVSSGDTNNDEQAIGLVSTIGLLAGAYLGFRWTAGLDAGKDVHVGGRKAEPDDAPLALLRRSSDGRYSAGAPSPRTSVQAPQPAYLLDLVAGRF